MLLLAFLALLAQVATPLCKCQVDDSRLLTRSLFIYFSLNGSVFIITSKNIMNYITNLLYFNFLRLLKFYPNGLGYTRFPIRVILFSRMVMENS